MAKLAINGGPKVASEPFPKQLTVGQEEGVAVFDLLKNKEMLSGFRGSWQDAFWGGPQVRALEREWSDYHGVEPPAMAVNSCTSALQIACGAIGLMPGDEVIVTPWSMTCSATAPMIYGAVPVFADIDPMTFCLDPNSIRKRITPMTRAIIVVDLFGRVSPMEIYKIALENDLKVIEDAAQAPGAWTENESLKAGTLGDIGCFSFTQGKHLTCGEGGMMLVGDDRLRMKCALIRNHAESVINAMPNDLQADYKNDPNMVGFNMRMTEVNAAIMREQLKRLDGYVDMRIKNVWKIYKALEDISFVSCGFFPVGEKNAYYVQPFYYNREEAGGIHRDTFVNAVIAELTGEEGRPDRPMLGNGYIKPLHLMPLFKNLGYAQEGFCPQCESLWRDRFFLSMYHNLPLSDADVSVISDAFHKVADNLGELQ